jgi:Uma2 family endonuclease
MLKPKKQTYSIEEYFALEEQAEYRSEYCDGEVFVMAGSSANHNRITLNTASFLNTALAEKDCEVFVNDLRVQLEKQRYYTYPDILIICGEPIFVEGRQDTVANPILIIEVLSESTKDYDRGSKFAAYRNITTLREYILIDQDEIHIEAFVKDDAGTWRLRDYFEQDEALVFESLHLTLPIQQLYQRIKFPSKPRLRAVRKAKKE